MPELERFYLLSHIFISLTGAVLLFAIWYSVRKRFRKVLEEEGGPRRVDKGLAFLSCSIFVWVVSGAWGFISKDLEQGNYFLDHGVRGLLSTANNFFLLYGLFYFEKAPEFIYRNEKSAKVMATVILSVSVLSVGLFGFLGDKVVYGINVSFVPDFLLSSFLSFLMAVAFFRTFRSKELKVVAAISIASIVLMLYSQLPEIISSMDNRFSNYLIRIVAKTSLISIFLVLATNWVIQLAQRPKPGELRLEFLDWSLIRLVLPSRNVPDQALDLGGKTTQFKNLLRFAIRRKFGKGEGQYLEVGKGGEIKGQTYLTRIVDNINQAAGLEEEEKLDRKDLFTFVGQGKYRLRVLPEHIRFDDSLLYEFYEDVENQDYKTIVTNCN
ncbi:hypothetical protein FUAX_51290 (plasmid) [Fulvitalea axinellae]|uniref:Uncharacterized protein n=1 Tax=Fulvitalea axinellae TaxID=1182444 RepID=A0AAU9D5R3_9BACT|nr:hypothetical protein FUAX_51290 [Fulvitalea axinellae]